jgi:hypothetical protein
MNLAYAVFSLVTLAAEPVPLDAFRANFASIKVDMEFTHQGGQADPSIVGRLSSLKEPEFDASPGFGEPYGRSEITGRWAYDGTTQLHDFGSPDWVLQKIKDAHGGVLPRSFAGFVESREELFDGTILAIHRRERDDRSFGPIDVLIDREFIDRERRNLVQGSSPFIWWWGSEFPAFLDEDVPGVVPERHASQRDGHPVVVEIYSHSHEITSSLSYQPQGKSKSIAKPIVSNQLEIAYDPAIGYLPCYARMIHTVDGKSRVLEMSLVEARRCASGGFVPVEWYSTSFLINDFAARYPSHDSETLLVPTGRIHLSHFKASSFKDCTAPVALTHVANHKFLSSHSNVFPLEPGTKTLTMSDIKSTLGPWLDDPTHPLLPKPGTSPPQGPDPDADPNHLRPVLPWPLGVGFILLAGILLIRHRSRKAAKR